MNRKERRVAQRNARSTGQVFLPANASPAVAGLLSRAQTLHNSGRLVEAIDLCKGVLSTERRNAEALLIIGSAKAQMGDLPAAREFVEQSVATQRKDPRAWLVLSSLLTRQGDATAAFRACRTALDLAPNLPVAHAELGNIRAAEGKYQLAELSYRKALTLDPNYIDASVNLGSALFRLGRLDESRISLQRALALSPDHPVAWKNLAATWRALGEFDQSITCYRRATAIDLQFAEAHRDEALLLLLTGKYREGWEKYEWRWRASTVGARMVEGRRWAGEDIRGRRILLQSEQGLGDTIQMLRYAPLIAEMGGHVLLNLPSPLTRLVNATMSDIAQTSSWDDVLPDFDCYAYMLSLPGVFGTDVDTIPAKTPYLKAPLQCIEDWRQRLAGDRMRIGIVWAGNPAHENDHNRSIAIERMLPLLSTPNCIFYGLQVDGKAADLKTARGNGIVDLSERLVDLCETAGLIETLDLVITVDTSVAHLAGALGRPVWVLLPFIPDWRWMLGSEYTPWYPTMRLFRQQAHNAWDEVIARAKRELSGIAAAR